MKKTLNPVAAAICLWVLGFSIAAEQDASGAGVPRSGWIELNDARLFYEESGRGTPLILAHGGLLDGTMWDGHFEVFARAFRTIRYDARGHGRSSGSREDYLHSADLLGLCDALGIEKAIFVGFSLGGRTAVDFAVVNPQRVIALVLVAPGLSGFDFTSPECTANQKAFTKAWRNRDVEGVIEIFLDGWLVGPRRSGADVSPDLWDKMQSMVRDNVLRPQEGGRWREIEPPALQRLGDVKAPVLILAGDMDMPDILEIADRMESGIRGSRKVILSGVGHMISLERPEEFLRLVLDFLAFLEQD